MTQYLLAIDGGQTSTKAMLATLEGEVLGSGLGGPCVRFDEAGGYERNRASIGAAVGSACAAAGVHPPSVVACGLGLTGFHTGGVELPLIERATGDAIGYDRIAAVGDYVTNLLGASAGAPGVAIIAGGGSVAYGIAAAGREARAGAFGWLLGDEGSAYALGHQALIAAARASDGRGPATLLTAEVCRAFGVSAAWDLIHVVYRPEFTRDRVSALAPAVSRAARAGDVVALDLLTTAGHDLANAALAVIRALYAPGTPVPVFPTGGVFLAAELVLAPLRTRLAEGWPAATIAEPAFSPTVGALILARRTAGCEVGVDWLSTVSGSIGAAPGPR